MSKKSSLKSFKLAVGTVFQKIPNGNFYFRFQINGSRKLVALKTNDEAIAREEAQKIIPIVQTKVVDVVAAHVKHAHQMVKKHSKLRLVDAWEVYSEHLDRARPATIQEELAYQATFNQFVKHVTQNKSTLLVSDITRYIADKFVQYLKHTGLSVSTHNRRVRHLRKIFDTLKEYYEGENPFAEIKLLFRKPREEREHIQRRQAFSPEQIQAILKALDDPENKVKYKHEIKLLYIIGMCTGQRLKDCVLLRWDSINLDVRRLWIEQFKTGKKVSIPIANILFDALQEAKTWQINQYVCPESASRYCRVDERGKNIGSNLVNKDVLRPIKWAGMELTVSMQGRKKKTTLYGFHSLRHSFASFAAQAGIPRSTVISILGADSDIIEKHYVHVSEDSQALAVESISSSMTGCVKVTQNSKTENELTCIEQALKLLDATPDLSPDFIVKMKSILAQQKDT